MSTLKVKLTLQEELLGTAASPDVHREYIASKAPDAASTEEEVEALGVDAVVENGMTVFPLDSEGFPIMWDYQIKGFFKDACGMLSRAKGTKSSTLTAYRKIIDGMVFVKPRQIRLNMPSGSSMGVCQRPLRAQTAQGERIALASSKTVPAGTTIEFEIEFFDLSAKSKACSLTEIIAEWLDYGQLRGLGQWRNSGKGKFSYEIV